MEKKVALQIVNTYSVEEISKAMSASGIPVQDSGDFVDTIRPPH